SQLQAVLRVRTGEALGDDPGLGPPGHLLRRAGHGRRGGACTGPLPGTPDMTGDDPKSEGAGDVMSSDDAATSSGSVPAAGRPVVDIHGVEKVFDADRGPLTALRAID